MGSFGAGSPGHLGTHIFGEAAGLNPEVVQYTTTGDALAGLMNGDVAGTFTSVGLSIPNIKSGRLISVGSTGPSRNPNLPDVATFAEQGFPAVRFSSWHGVVAPTGTPPEIIAKLEADIRAAMEGDGRTRLEAAGFRAASPSTEEFRRFISSEQDIWGKVVAKTGLKIN
jgi:tripartite-type tricarboxylate transporter receptor subunit TctC